MCCAEGEYGLLHFSTFHSLLCTCSRRLRLGLGIIGRKSCSVGHPTNEPTVEVRRRLGPSVSVRQSSIPGPSQNAPPYTYACDQPPAHSLCASLSLSHQTDSISVLLLPSYLQNSVLRMRVVNAIYNTCTQMHLHRDDLGAPLTECPTQGRCVLGGGGCQDPRYLNSIYEYSHWRSEYLRFYLRFAALFPRLRTSIIHHITSPCIRSA